MLLFVGCHLPILSQSIRPWSWTSGYQQRLSGGAPPLIDERDTQDPDSTVSVQTSRTGAPEAESVAAGGGLAADTVGQESGRQWPAGNADEGGVSASDRYAGCEVDSGQGVGADRLPVLLQRIREHHPRGLGGHSAHGPPRLTALRDPGLER